MWNCCFRESKYSQAASSSQLNFAYKRCCAPSLKPGGFSAALAMFWGNQRSKFVKRIGMSWSTAFWSISIILPKNPMRKALYLANSLLHLDTHRFLLWGRRRVKASSARVSKLTTPKKISRLYRSSFDYKKPISWNPTYKKQAILKKFFYTILPRKTPIFHIQ